MLRFTAVPGTTRSPAARAAIPSYPDAAVGTDTIVDFDREDRIDLSRFSGIFGFDDLTITAIGDDVVIDLRAYRGGTIRLLNVDVVDLNSTD